MTTKSAGDAPLLLGNQVCFAVYSTAHAFNRFYKPLLERLGLTYPQYLVMLVLWEQDGPTVSELGERLFLDSGTLTPLLKRMEAAGWLSRQRASDDERRVIVSLSAEGRALKRRAQGVPLELASATGCSADELVALTRQLQQLRTQLLDARPESPTH